MRQCVLPERDLDFHAGVGVVAEHLHHVRHRLRVLRGLRDDLDRHHLARFRPVLRVRRHQELLADALVFRRHEQDAVLAVQPPHQTLVGVLEHFHDLAFGTAAPVGAGNARDHAVAVQHLVHFLRTEEEVGAAAVAHEEPESIGMSLHPAANQIEFRHHADRVAAVAHDLAVALHGGDAPRERLALVRRDVEQAFEIGFGEGHAVLGQRLQDGVAARQRVRCGARGVSGVRTGVRAVWFFH